MSETSPASQHRPTSNVQSWIPALQAFSLFIRQNWARVLAVSLLALIPCFWHREIIAGDLGSHVYNTWLAQLIERSQISGLVIVHQWDNVLFDLLLSGLAKIVSIGAAEHIAVALSVLIFFWGAFAFASAAARRINWAVIPALAIVAYGWTFEMGFFNYYLSLGLSCFALALFWRGSPQERIISLAFVPLVYMAHPIGLLWLIGMAAYLAIAERFSVYGQIGLLSGAVFALAMVHFYLLHHFRTAPIPLPFFLYNGADQLALFGTRYWVLCLLFLVAIGAVLLAYFRSRASGSGWATYGIIAQIYLITEIGILLAPDKVWLAKYPAPAEMISARLTTISAVLLCCLLMAVPPKPWHWAAFGAIALGFFALLYQDTGAVARMEEQARQLVHTLPPGQRVLATIEPVRHSRVYISHIADRACVGYCFSYANYEPPSRQFRIRVAAPNPYEVMDDSTTTEIQEGRYIVRAADLPAYELSRCTPASTRMCLYSLVAGEKNQEFQVRAPSVVSSLSKASAR